jgi:tetraacyldisaccharide 4'-kinase
MHGARPAIVMRGYGEDEPEVHRALNPEVEVVVGADRASAVEDAVRRGADIAVLDDGFQHRQLKRDVDIVLISADRWTDDVKLLPAGPWREPLTAARRADLLIVTRKAAASREVDRVHEELARVAPRVPRVSVALEADDLVRVGGDERLPPAALAGQRVIAVSAIGDPSAFTRQLEAHGAAVTPVAYRDHHDFSRSDVAEVIRVVSGAAMVVCTLKDAVKLRDRWPREAPPLWYVSQRVVVERGVGGIERLLEAALGARDAKTSPANSGPV